MGPPETEKRPGPKEARIAKALARLHLDDPERLDRWQDWLAQDTPPEPSPPDTRAGRLQLMLFAALGHRRRPVAELGAAPETGRN